MLGQISRWFCVTNCLKFWIWNWTGGTSLMVQSRLPAPSPGSILVRRSDPTCQAARPKDLKQNKTKKPTGVHISWACNETRDSSCLPQAIKPTKVSCFSLQVTCISRERESTWLTDYCLELVSRPQTAAEGSQDMTCRLVLMLWCTGEQRWCSQVVAVRPALCLELWGRGPGDQRQSPPLRITIRCPRQTLTGVQGTSNMEGQVQS